MPLGLEECSGLWQGTRGLFAGWRGGPEDVLFARGQTRICLTRGLVGPW